MRLLADAVDISRELSQAALEERAAALLEARPGTGRLRPSQPAIPADVAEFRRQGEYWSIVYVPTGAATEPVTYRGFIGEVATVHQLR